MFSFGVFLMFASVHGSCVKSVHEAWLFCLSDLAIDWMDDVRSARVRIAYLDTSRKNGMGGQATVARNQTAVRYPARSDGK